jgi:hypothetical protein
MLAASDPELMQRIVVFQDALRDTARLKDEALQQNL